MKPFAALLASILATAPIPAVAQQAQCMPRATLIEIAAQRYQEQPVHVGVVDESGVLEILIAPDGGWTAIVTAANGMSCVIGNGTDWSEGTPPQEAFPES